MAQPPHSWQYSQSGIRLPEGFHFPAGAGWPWLELGALCTSLSCFLLAMQSLNALTWGWQCRQSCCSAMQCCSARCWAMQPVLETMASTGSSSSSSSSSDTRLLPCPGLAITAGRVVPGVGCCLPVNRRNTPRCLAPSAPLSHTPMVLSTLHAHMVPQKGLFPSPGRPQHPFMQHMHLHGYPSCLLP